MKQIDYKLVGNRLKQAREEKGISECDFNETEFILSIYNEEESRREVWDDVWHQKLCFDYSLTSNPYTYGMKLYWMIHFIG